MTVPHGPEVPSHEDVYRAILYPIWWVEHEGRPSSAAFDYPVFSVDVASRTTPQQTAAQFRDVSKIVQFNCGKARELSFDARDERDDVNPDNDAHAHVCFYDYHTLGGKQRKKRIRQLIEVCIPLEVGP
jgi:hypothetical protein